jgi:SMODS and SLOG-associating 2TM effector domain family 5
MLRKAYPADDILDMTPSLGRKTKRESIIAKLEDDWRLVKRARFNASKKFERKQEASLVAFTLAALVGPSAFVCTLVFADALAPHTKSVIDFGSYVVALFSLAFGLIEQSKDYPSKVSKFHECGLAVNRALRALKFLEPSDEPGLLKSVEDYDRAIENCGENHNDLDYSIAQVFDEIRSKDTSARQAARRRLRFLRFRETCEVYGVYVVILIMPALAAFVIWLKI